MTGELTPEEMENVLHEQVYGHIAMSNGKEPYVVPFTYVYSAGALYSHTYEGKKIAWLRNNPLVCVNIMDMQDMSHWKSVNCTGTYQELEGEEAAQAITVLVQHLSEKAGDKGIHLPFRYDAQAVTTREAGQEHPIFYKIDINHKSGRFEQTDANNN